MPESVAVLIRCRNEEAHIGRLLTGIGRQTRPADEVIVVDSGSTDASIAIANAFGARVIAIEPSQFSFGRAINLGMAETDCEAVVLASAHVYPIYDSWIERLTEPLTDPDVALAYGRQVAPHTSPWSERRLLGQWFPVSSREKTTESFCNNANAAVRRSVWEEIPYDEQLTGLEDLDFAKRAISGGHFLAYVAEAPVVHVHDESFAEIINRYRREAIAHKQIYPEQSLGVLAAARLCLANIADDLATATLGGEIHRQALEILRFRTAQFYGSQRGFAQAGPVADSLRRRFYYPPEDRGDIADAPAPGLLIDYEDEPEPSPYSST